MLSVSNQIKNNSWTADCVHHFAKGSVFDDPYWRQLTIFLQNHQQQWCLSRKSILPSYLLCFCVLSV